MATKQSKEVKIQREVEKWLTSYDMEFVTQNESVNPEIDKALSKAPSKTGGEGAIKGVVKWSAKRLEELKKEKNNV
ncbi:hypothetical protein QSV38_07790 [Streptococcus parasuis]|uniref:hypothetical protein n=1 Tax=Streptococcus parasuis TaxID=1501662 RepID=UPI0025A6765B|nr:hypothetical protein [Streptococcus parasuis]WJQ85226.1 hypothetical protein QSV38_07790 [Streptococcus parasuis]